MEGHILLMKYDKVTKDDIHSRSTMSHRAEDTGDLLKTKLASSQAIRIVHTQCRHYWRREDRKIYPWGLQLSQGEAGQGHYLGNRASGRR